MKIFLTVFFLAISNFVFSQDYKKQLSKSSCDCLRNIDTENKDKKVITSQFGLCMIKNAIPFTKEIKKDYGIDLSKDISNTTKMKELGGQIGMLMVVECQELFEKITQNDEDVDESSESSYSLLSGTVKKIEKGNYIVFHLIGDNKVLNKFYWVTNIESTLDLPKEYDHLVNKKVSLSYYSAEIFDVSINDYRTVNVISSLKTD